MIDTFDFYFWRGLALLWFVISACLVVAGFWVWTLWLLAAFSVFAGYIYWKFV